MHSSSNTNNSSAVYTPAKHQQQRGASPLRMPLSSKAGSSTSGTSMSQRDYSNSHNQPQQSQQNHFSFRQKSTHSMHNQAGHSYYSGESHSNSGAGAVTGTRLKQYYSGSIPQNTSLKQSLDESSSFQHSYGSPESTSAEPRQLSSASRSNNQIALSAQRNQKKRSISISVKAPPQQHLQQQLPSITPTNSTKQRKSARLFGSSARQKVLSNSMVPPQPSLSPVNATGTAEPTTAHHLEADVTQSCEGSLSHNAALLELYKVRKTLDLTEFDKGKAVKPTTLLAALRHKQPTIDSSSSYYTRFAKEQKPIENDSNLEQNIDQIPRDGFISPTPVFRINRVPIAGQSAKHTSKSLKMEPAKQVKVGQYLKASMNLGTVNRSQDYKSSNSNSISSTVNSTISVNQSDRTSKNRDSINQVMLLPSIEADLSLPIEQTAIQCGIQLELECQQKQQPNDELSNSSQMSSDDQNNATAESDSEKQHNSKQEDNTVVAADQIPSQQTGCMAESNQIDEQQNSQIATTITEQAPDNDVDVKASTEQEQGHHPAFALRKVCVSQKTEPAKKVDLVALLRFGEQLGQLYNMLSLFDAQSQNVESQQQYFLALSEECHTLLEILRIDKQLEDLLCLFKEEKAKKIIKQAMIFERINMIFIAQNLLSKDVFVTNFKYLKGILSYAHSNHLHLITIIQQKLLRKSTVGSSINNITTSTTENSLSEDESRFIDLASVLIASSHINNNNNNSSNSANNSNSQPNRSQKHIIQILNQIRQNNEICINSFKTLAKNDKDFYSYILNFLKNIERSASVNTVFFSILQYFSLYLTLRHHSSEEPAFVNLPYLQTSPSPYLSEPPQQSRPYTLVLDLDETLIHYSEQQGNVKQFAVRPFVQSFLHQVSEFYEIVVFTAGMPDYANWVINTFDTRNYIKHRLYRQHTIQIQNTYIKDLSRIGRDLSKTIIIDNLAENFQLQPDNGIFIREWTGDPSDNALAELLPLLKEIAIKKSADVRQALQSLKEQIQTNISNGVECPHLNLKL